eukprot:5635160-Amphidinium_carterae.1
MDRLEQTACLRFFSPARPAPSECAQASHPECSKDKTLLGTKPVRRHFCYEVNLQRQKSPCTTPAVGLNGDRVLYDAFAEL